MPKVSYIFAVHNAESYLEKVLKFLRGWNFSDFECIIVNDGSTDGSYRIIREYMKLDERFRYAEKPAYVFTEPRNVGIPLAKGEYVQFINSDKLFYFKLTPGLLRVAEEQEADMAVWNYRFEGECLTPEKETGFRNHVCEFLYNTRRMDTCNSKLYKRELLEKSRAEFDSHMGYAADQLFDLKIFPSARKISVMEEVRPEEERYNSFEAYTPQYTGEHWGKELKLIETLDHFLAANGSKHDRYYEKFVELHVCRGIDGFLEQDCKKSLYRIRSEVKSYCYIDLPPVVSGKTLNNIKRYANKMLGLIFMEEA